jgi:hypothetical protein
MRLLVVGVLAAVLCVLLSIAVLTGYRQDQQVIRWFDGTGIAGKVDVVGAQPDHLVVENQENRSRIDVAVLSDGTFIAPLEPGTYRLHTVHDSRSITVVVPERECVEVVLDLRIPGVVLTVPGEGWPVPQIAS